MPGLVLLLLGFSACGNGADTETRTTYGSPNNEIPTADLPESQRAALRTYVYCSGRKCDPSVAMMILASDDRLGACTASMIAKDVAVTNSHCVPDELKSDGADCSGRIHLFFPQIGDLPAERAECAEVLRASTLTDKKSNNPDYAFIRLSAPVSREPLPFSEAGFVQGNAYRIPKVDPSPQRDGTFVGALRSTECKAIYSTALTMTANSPDSPVMSFRECDIEHGNSGSPILDGKGNLVGVIQAKFEPSALSSFGMATSADFLDGVPNSLAIGTNLGCVSFPAVLPERPLPSACSIGNSPEEVDVATKAIGAAIVAKMTRTAMDATRGTLAKPLEQVFEWTLANRTTGTFTKQNYSVLVPKCFRPVSGWIKDYKGLLGGVKSSVSADVSIPYWRAKVGINSSLQLDGRLEKDTRAFYASEITFSPKDVSESGSSTVVLEDKNAGLFANGKYMSERLKVCN